MRKSPSPNKISTEDAVIIENIYRQSGQTYTSVAAQTKFSRNQIYTYFKKHHIKAKPPEISNRKYSLNDRFFEVIDSHEKAQILGFIAADGCVHKNDRNKIRTKGSCLEIEIHNKDRDYLEWIKDCMGYGGPISSNEYHCKLSIGSDKLVCDLIKLGITERKSLTLEFPKEEFLPKEFIPSFILGYFEGDGSIYHSIRNKHKYTSVSIVGTPNFLEKTKEFLANSGVACLLHRANKFTLFVVNICSQPEVAEFFRLIYKNSKFKMNRKYIRFIDFFERNEEKKNLDTTNKIKIIPDYSKMLAAA
jgi:hypothetical protein